MLEMRLRCKYATANVLDPMRLKTLNNCFERITSCFISLRPVLSEIQREYELVIEAILNIISEKNYISGKILKLLGEYPHKKLLDCRNEEIINLKDQLNRTCKDYQQYHSLIKLERYAS
jgi:Translin-associated factor X-interacting N-terminus